MFEILVFKTLIIALQNFIIRFIKISPEILDSLSNKSKIYAIADSSFVLRARNEEQASLRKFVSRDALPR